MAKNGSTPSTEGTDTVVIPRDRFDKATLKLECAAALVTTFGILSREAEAGEGIQVSGGVINSAMYGISLLIENAVDDLLPVKGGAA